MCTSTHDDESPAGAAGREREVSPWRADLRRYPVRPWFKEQSIWPIAVYRFGRWNDARRPGVTRWVLGKCYWVAYRVVETLTGISFLKSVEIGPGLKIWHFGNVFINPGVKIGANCTLRHGVTIGNRVEGGPVPVIGDDVEFGCYAQVLGDVRVGKGAKIGAMSVVLEDVPAGATVVGIPARIVGSGKVGKGRKGQEQPPADIALGYPLSAADVLDEVVRT